MSHALCCALFSWSGIESKMMVGVKGYAVMWAWYVALDSVRVKAEEASETST